MPLPEKVQFDQLDQLRNELTQSSEELTARESELVASLVTTFEQTPAFNEDGIDELVKKGLSQFTETLRKFKLASQKSEGTGIQIEEMLSGNVGLSIDVNFDQAHEPDQLAILAELFAKVGLDANSAMRDFQNTRAMDFTAIFDNTVRQLVKMTQTNPVARRIVFEAAKIFENKSSGNTKISQYFEPEFKGYYAQNKHIFEKKPRQPADILFVMHDLYTTGRYDLALVLARDLEFVEEYEPSGLNENHEYNFLLAKNLEASGDNIKALIHYKRTLFLIGKIDDARPMPADDDDDAEINRQKVESEIAQARRDLFERVCQSAIERLS